MILEQTYHADTMESNSSEGIRTNAEAMTAAALSIALKNILNLHSEKEVTFYETLCSKVVRYHEPRGFGINIFELSSGIISNGQYT